jgi:hypothetical protein
MSMQWWCAIARSESHQQLAAVLCDRLHIRAGWLVEEKFENRLLGPTKFFKHLKSEEPDPFWVRGVQLGILRDSPTPGILVVYPVTQHLILREMTGLFDLSQLTLDKFVTFSTAILPHFFPSDA